MTNVLFIILDSIRRDHVGGYRNGWYEYPDIHGPTTSLAKRLRERYE